MKTCLRLACLLTAVALLPACEGDTVIHGSTGAPSGSLVVLGQTNELFWVSPSTPDRIQGAVAVWGLNGTGTVLRCIAFRPADGFLYAYATDGRLYRVRTEDGFAEMVGAGSIGFAGAAFHGMGVSPTGDRIRIVTEDEHNNRFDPETAELSGDSALSPDSYVVEIAYTNSFPGATTTTVYGIDTLSDQLVMIGGVGGNPSPNLGAVSVVGPLGIAADAGTGGVHAGAGFDISRGGIAYAALFVGPTTGLYTIDLSTGAATLVGPLGSGGPIRGMAIRP